ncbi:nuclear transport factor 2 family protein [Sphingomonas sp. PAMC 26605]|uniref:nuclear transport factor 2 family protein n=1 Tax=Sphingomonas sp. PAMC 26605 TaxID=1112214 RepID=UPI0009D9637C|nr:nuclear transport factor 2 family protein [Sphingomonas sp. PAMC 26605]
MTDIEKLIEIEELRRLEARYAYYADHKKWSNLAGLFSVNGWFRPLDVEGNEIFKMVGREEIAFALASRNSGDVQPIHQLFTHEINILSPTSATAIWAMADFIFRGDSAIPERDPAAKMPPFRTMRGWGHYHVTYEKTEERSAAEAEREKPFPGADLSSVEVEGPRPSRSPAWRIATRTQTRTRLEFTY